ncbi:hypothetical protein LJB86_01120 [Deltaproteobacteria bacterium OttesenSCG-928-M10]|nr:hypothetical protein [Deltaproteobacteria bacterium OttesenSCG-928-M10]
MSAAKQKMSFLLGGQRASFMQVASLRLPLVDQAILIMVWAASASFQPLPPCRPAAEPFNVILYLYCLLFYYILNIKVCSGSFQGAERAGEELYGDFKPTKHQYFQQRGYA